MDKRTLSGLAMAVAAYFAWGLLAPVGKLLLEDLPPMGLNAWRMILATLLLAPFISARQWRLALDYLRQPHIVGLALVGSGVSFTFYLYALTRLDATFTVLGFYTAPLWTAVLAAWWLRERIGWAFLPAVVALLAGSALALFGRTGASLVGVDGVGMVLAVLAGLGWAVYAVGLRRYAPGLSLRALLGASFLAATAYFVLGALVVEGGIPDPTGFSTATWGWLLVHAALPTTFSVFLFNASLQRAPASAVNILVGVELAATVLFAWLLLGDQFDLVQVIGLAVALVAVSAYLWHRTRPLRIMGAGATGLDD